MNSVTAKFKGDGKFIPAFSVQMKVKPEENPLVAIEETLKRMGLQSLFDSKWKMKVSIETTVKKWPHQ